MVATLSWDKSKCPALFKMNSFSKISIPSDRHPHLLLTPSPNKCGVMSFLWASSGRTLVLDP